MTKRKFIRRDKDAKGNERWYFRRPGSPQIRLPDGPAHPLFDQAYDAALEGKKLVNGTKKEPVRQRPPVCAPRHERLRGGYIYFLRLGDTVKIGYSTDPFARATTLSVGIPGKIDAFVVVPGTRAIERECHRKFATHRISGEWFRMAEGVRVAMERAAKYGRFDPGNEPPLSQEHFSSRKSAAKNEGGAP